MTSDPRLTLSTFVAALETHLEMSAVRRGDDDPAVAAAYERVADAFEAYDDALLAAYGEVTPLDLFTDDEDEDDDYVDEDELEDLTDDYGEEDDDDLADDDGDDDEDDDGDNEQGGR